LKSDFGVSELIGAILLVSLVVVLMMVVTTVILSQPRPEKIPEMSAAISLSGVDGNYKVNITHMGGDELKEGEYSVVINNKMVLRNGPVWSVNNPTIAITSNAIKPLSIEVYYMGSSNQVLLAKTYFV
jgi:FlaG/FlaF family flagellin (archaellin)